MSRDRKRNGRPQTGPGLFFQNWREGLEHLPVAASFGMEERCEAEEVGCAEPTLGDQDSENSRGLLWLSAVGHVGVSLRGLGKTPSSFIESIREKKAVNKADELFQIDTIKSKEF